MPFLQPLIGGKELLVQTDGLLIGQVHLETALGVRATVQAACGLRATSGLRAASGSVQAVHDFRVTVRGHASSAKKKKRRAAPIGSNSKVNLKKRWAAEPAALEGAAPATGVFERLTNAFNVPRTRPREGGKAHEYLAACAVGVGTAYMMAQDNVGFLPGVEAARDTATTGQGVAANDD